MFAPEVGAREPLKRMTRGGVFGWAGLLLGQTKRLATVTAAEPTEVLRIDTEALVALLESEPLEGGRVMERFAGMIQREFTRAGDARAGAAAFRAAHRGDVEDRA